jgi:intracellular septation protein
MKLFLDLFPVVLFFITFKVGGTHGEELSLFLTQYAGFLTQSGSIGPKEAPILAATCVTVIATLAQVLIQKSLGKKVETMQWVTLGIIVVLGGATLFFNDEGFIKLKPTVVYWALASALLFWQWVLKRNALQLMLGAQLKLPEAIYSRLSTAWATFFLTMGAVNLWIAHHWTTDQWVNFKLFGTLGATIGFIILQSIFLAKHLQPNAMESVNNEPTDSNHS